MAEAVELLRSWFGLTGYEARVYVEALKGVSRPRDMSRRARVPVTRVYDVLRSLESKGFVTVGRGRVRATKPSAAVRSAILQIDSRLEKERAERLRAYDKLMSLLSKWSRPEEPEAAAEVLRGLPSISSKVLELCEGSKEIVFAVRRGIRVKDSMKHLLQQLGPQRRSFTFIVDPGVQLTNEDEQFINHLEARLVRKDVWFDIMVADYRDVLIGVPTVRDDAVAVWVRDKEFAGPVMKTLVGP